MAAHRKGPAERRYCHVQVRVWTDEETTGEGMPPPHPLTLWTYLLTTPQSLRVPGVIAAGRRALAEALEWSEEDFDRCIAPWMSKGMVIADWKARLVYLPGALRQPENHPSSPPTVVTWKRELMNAPECDLLHRVVADVRGLLSQMSPGFLACFDAGARVGSGRLTRELPTTQATRQLTTCPTAQPTALATAQPGELAGGIPSLAPALSLDPDPTPTSVVSTTHPIPRAQSEGAKGKADQKVEPGAYAVLDAFQQAAGGVLLLDLVPQRPPPAPGLSGRLPMGLENQWCGLLTVYKAEHGITGADLLDRVKRAGEYLRAGCWSWAYRGASGLALHSLCDQRKGLFGRLLTEAAAWDGVAAQAASAPPSSQEVADISSRRRQEAIEQEEVRRRKRAEAEARQASPEEARRLAAEALAALERSSEG